MKVGRVCNRSEGVGGTVADFVSLLSSGIGCVQLLLISVATTPAIGFSLLDSDTCARKLKGGEAL